LRQIINLVWEAIDADQTGISGWICSITNEFSAARARQAIYFPSGGSSQHLIFVALARNSLRIALILAMADRRFLHTGLL
jgi:hypothetical protein